MPLPAYLIDLAQTDYRRTHDLQKAAVAARHTGRLDRELIIMLEHPPVFTLGRRGGRDNLMVSEEVIKERGITIEHVERGGDITYHGPGQLVAYLIMDLNRTRLSVTDFVTALENAMVQTAAHWQIDARGDAAYRGAWVGQRKLGSVGITVRRGVTFHGMALNISTDMEPFTWINPCGLSGCTMTSLSKESGSTVEMQTVKTYLSQHLSHLLNLALTPIKLEHLGIPY